MEAIAVIGLVLNLIPVVRSGWRWWLEYRLEVDVKAHYPDMGNPYRIYPPDRADQQGGRVWALLDLTLRNHRSDRPQMVAECWAELKKSRLLFWQRTLAQIPVIVPNPGQLEKGEPIKDVLLEPFSPAYTQTIVVSGQTGVFDMPRRSKLVLVLKMVGPVRRLERVVLTDVKHDPSTFEEQSEKGSTTK